MANAFNGKVWILDTIGVIKKGPIVIRKIVLRPNAAADAATLVTWNDSDTAHSSALTATGTITNTNDLTATGLFTSSLVTALDIIDITKSSGSSANVGAFLVGARDGDNQISISPPTVTNEASIVYAWNIYTPVECMYMKASALAADATGYDFGDEGFRFQNLALSALSDSAKVYVFLK
jgi:hypothetical protein